MALAVVSDDAAALGKLVAFLAEARALDAFVSQELAGAADGVYNPLGECLLKQGYPIHCLAAFGHKRAHDEEYDSPLLLRAVKAAGWKAALGAAGYPGRWLMAAALAGFISFIVLLINAAAGMLTAMFSVAPCIICAFRARSRPSEAAILNEQVSRALRQISSSGQIPLKPASVHGGAQSRKAFSWGETRLEALLLKIKTDFYVQIAVLVHLGLISGTILRGFPTQFWNLIFISSLAGAVACGFRARRSLFFLGLTIGTNLLARVVFVIDLTASQAFYYGFAAVFFVAGAGLVGAVLGDVKRRLESDIDGEQKASQPKI